MNAILHKVINFSDFQGMEKTVITRTAYRLTEQLHKEHPEAISQLSKGHAYDMSTNIFERLPQVFFDEKPDDNYKYIRILGRENNQRIYKYIRADFVNEPKNLYSYKVFLPSGNGNGQFGEVLTAVSYTHLIEAARMEGIGSLKIMRDIILPLVRPSILTTGIIFFINSWNEYVWPVLILKSKENYTLSLALQMYISAEGGTEFTIAMAVSVITMIIPLALYLIFQRYIINTFAASGVKG